VDASELFGLAQGEWKYVEAPAAAAEDGRARAELLRPGADPRELDDRAAHEPERTRALAAELHALRRAFEAEAWGAAPHAPSESDLDALAALGYGGLDVSAVVPGIDGELAPARDPRTVAAAIGLLGLVQLRANGGQFEEAARALARLEELAPGGIVLHEARGDFHLARGRSGARADLERAAAEFAAATELMPGRRGLWLRRSEALERLGRLAEALECIDHALALAPPMPAFLAAREELRRRVEASPR
jgi:tetratricopeptide (TPR) repeat protein